MRNLLFSLTHCLAMFIRTGDLVCYCCSMLLRYGFKHPSNFLMKMNELVRKTLIIVHVSR